MKAIILAAGYATRLLAAHGDDREAAAARSAGGRWSTTCSTGSARSTRSTTIHVVTNHKFADSFVALGRDAERGRRSVHDDGTTSERRPARRDRRHPLRASTRRARDDDLLVDRRRQPLRLQRSPTTCAGGAGKGEASAVALYDVGDLELVEAVQHRRARRRRPRSSASSRSPRARPTTLVRDRDVPLPPRARAARRARTSTRATRPTSPAASSPGSSRACPSTATASRATGATSATRPSCSRRTTGSGSGRAAPPGFLLPRLECRPMATHRARAPRTSAGTSPTSARTPTRRARSGSTLVETRAGLRARATAARSPSLDAPGLRALLDEADELEQELSRLQVYSYLRLSMAATDVEANDLATFSRDRVAEIENDARLPRPRVDRARRRPRRGAARRRRARAVRAQAARRAGGEAVRPERAGGAGAERAPPDGLGLAGAARPARLDARGAVRRGRGRAAAHDQPAALVSLPPRPRRSALRAVTRSSRGSRRAPTCWPPCYDALVGDRLTIDRLRGYTNPMQPTNMGNELDDEIVEAMMTATEESYRSRRKWFEAKARLLGLDKLELADQYAPIGEARALHVARGGRHRRHVVRPLLAAARGDLPRRASTRPRRRAAAERQGPAARTARRSRRRSCRTSS